MQLELSPTRISYEQTIPLGHELVGWTALAHALAIQAPVRWLGCISDQHVSQNSRKEGIWTVYDKRYWPGNSLEDHLGFALRHEELDLLVLKRVFDAVSQAELRRWSVPQTHRHARAPCLVFLRNSHRLHTRCGRRA
jgi:hypothetical protein